MWRARAPSRRLGSTRSRRGASRRSTTCTRSAPPASPAPSWDARCTKAASPSSRRSSARPRDGRPGPAAHDRTRRAGAAAVEPDDGALRRGRESHAAARVARRLPQHRGPRGSLARGTRHGARSGAEWGRGVRVGERPHQAARLARVHMIVLPRPAVFDAFVSDIVGPRRVGAGDTVRLRVSYGTTGKTAGERGRGKGTLLVSLGNRRLMSRVVSLPDSGILSAEITLPPSPFPGSLPAGWQALELRLEGGAGEDRKST